MTVTPSVVTSPTGPGAPSPRPRGEWADRFVGSDPGLNRFRSAVQSVLTIAAALGAEWLFVQLTHALQAPAGGARLTAAQAAANHEYLVIAMLLGAIVAMLSSFGVMDHTAKGQLVTMLFLPVPMVAAMAMGLSLGPHRVAALVSLAVVLAVGTYCRRFGPRGFIVGMLLFMGDFFGFFLYGAVTLSDLGWLTAELGVGLVVAVAVRFGFFYPHQAKALARTQRSYGARARKVAALALGLFDDPEHTERQGRRLARQLVRLNEAALMIDAQLGDPSALGAGSSGELVHQRLFDIELALTNIARFAVAMGRLDLPADRCSSVRLALLDICEGDFGGAARHAGDLAGQLRDLGAVPTGMDPAIVVPHRFAGSVIDLADAVCEWLALAATAATTRDDNPTADGVVFEPAVMLNGAWLPGSSQVSATASQERGWRRSELFTLAPYTRTAIQMGVAVGAALALGDVLSGRRFYWAVIGAFITFMGANNTGEQIRKALFRVAGTVIGIAAGSGIVDLVGHHTNWSLAVILVALFIGFYLQRINYAFMVIAITVMVSQLYVQLGEFTNELLVLRLEETALGAAVGIATVMLVLPLRTRRVLRVALRTHLEAVSSLVEHATDQLLDADPDHERSLRDDARDIDVSYQALIFTAQPLRRNLFGDLDETTGQAMRLAGAARNYSRNLVADIKRADPLDADTRQDLNRAAATLRSSLDAVIAALNNRRDGTYTRSSALFDRAERRLEEHSGGVDRGGLAIRDLKLIDGTLASMAQALQLEVTDYDTVPADHGGTMVPST